jgi:hypothetical protein
MRPFIDHRGPADTDIPGPISQPQAAASSPLAGIPVYSGPFSVEVHRHRDTVRIAPIGELDLATGPALSGPNTQWLFEISGLLARLPFRAGVPAEHLYPGPRQAV